MQLFYSPEITLPVHYLDREESAHCVRVLRLTEGGVISLTDGQGTLYKSVIRKADPKGCEVEITETITDFEKRPYGITVVAAPTKNADRYEWFAEKATETGVDRIIPIECRYSERRKFNRERTERVIVSAMKQSLKAYKPELEELSPVAEIIARPFDGVKLIAHCNPDDQRTFIGECLKPCTDILILIGPEGDFSEEEVALAKKNGFKAVSLGQTRLRTETAALAVVTIAAFVNG